MIALALINQVSAKNTTYALELTEKTYEISKITEKGEYTIVYFNISLTIRNNGDNQSDLIQIIIEDEDGMTLNQTAIIPPHTNITFHFPPHPLIGTQQHQINITYEPKDPYILRTPYNHGQETLILLETKNTTTNTPALEISIILLTILTIFIIKKRFQ